jgi:proteic killer suppression protein
LKDGSDTLQGLCGAWLHFPRIAMFSKLLYTGTVDKRYEVQLSAFVQKRFRRLPDYIQKAVRTWSTLIEEHGIWAMKRIPGYHDEPLHGDRKGQRSSRLSRGYRVIYEELDSGEIVVISVLEVTKHEY